MNWLPEEDLTCLSDDLFDDLINHMDSQLQDMDAINGEGDWEAKFQDLEPPPMDIFSTFPSDLTSCAISKAGHVGIQKTIPVLKQSSSSDALAAINSTIHHSSSPPDIKLPKLFQSSSPVSVLESSSSFWPRNSISQRLSFTVKGIRSKRKRLTTLRLKYLLPFELMKPKKELTPGESESESESYYSSEQQAKKQHKIQIVQKCTHCETTKTPQWREGPSGPKTLCNACGVRYRSGRLVPEYRPASSPTFIPSLHSNSHRKIIEMRRKDENKLDTGMIHAVVSSGA